MDMNIKAYELSRAIPNKTLNSDGSVTDFQGNIISPASEEGAKAFELLKSLPTWPNKWLDSDGTVKTWEEINGGGTTIVGENIIVTPTTEEQTITPDEGYNAILQVTVNPVDASIDEDIVATNIKSGVDILGVTGTVVEATEEVLEEAVTEAVAEAFGKEY